MLTQVISCLLLVVLSRASLFQQYGGDLEYETDLQDEDFSDNSATDLMENAFPLSDQWLNPIDDNQNTDSDYRDSIEDYFGKLQDRRGLPLTKGLLCQEKYSSPIPISSKTEAFPKFYYNITCVSQPPQMRKRTPSQICKAGERGACQTHHKSLQIFERHGACWKPSRTVMIAAGCKCSY